MRVNTRGLMMTLPPHPFTGLWGKLEISPPFVNEVLNLLINWLLTIRVATLWMNDTQKKNKIQIRKYLWKPEEAS